MVNIDSAKLLVNSKVTITFRGPDPEADGEVVTTLEDAYLIAVNPTAIMFRPKGSRTGSIVEAGKVDSIVGVTVRPKIIVKKLKPVTDKDAAQHLADRHGYTVSKVSEGSGAHWLNEHEGLDHSDLAHNHAE